MISVLDSICVSKEKKLRFGPRGANFSLKQRRKIREIVDACMLQLYFPSYAMADYRPGGTNPTVKDPVIPISKPSA